MHEDLSDQRVSYEQGTLEEKAVLRNPFEQFKKWYDEASAHKEIKEPNAMILCTATKDGFPSARPVLLKVNSKQAFKLIDRNLMNMVSHSSPIMKAESPKKSRRIPEPPLYFTGKL